MASMSLYSFSRTCALAYLNVRGELYMKMRMGGSLERHTDLEGWLPCCAEDGHGFDMHLDTICPCVGHGTVINGVRRGKMETERNEELARFLRNIAYTPWNLTMGAGSLLSSISSGFPSSY